MAQVTSYIVLSSAGVFEGWDSGTGLMQECYVFGSFLCEYSIHFYSRAIGADGKCSLECSGGLLEFVIVVKNVYNTNGIQAADAKNYKPPSLVLFLSVV